MKHAPGETLHELIRQALVLVRGTVRIEMLHRMRLVFTKDEFATRLACIVHETAAEYGPTYDDDCGTEQMFENAELPN
jgi:hypothetical protein